MADILSLLNPANITAALPPTFMNDVATNLAAGAAGTVLLAGLKSSAGQNALDPLGLFHKDAPQVPATNNPNVAVGPTITASAYAALPAATQAGLMAAGVHIVAG